MRSAIVSSEVNPDWATFLLKLFGGVWLLLGGTSNREPREVLPAKPAHMDTVLISDLPSWQEMAQGDEPGDATRDPTKQFKFKADIDINKKLKLWQGDIRRLQVDAIVNPTNETMSDSNGISGQILEAAGSELAAEIFKTEQCRTGEARITKACDLPAKFIIHTVGPRYNEKYRTAAENALHSCYKSSLTLLKENGLTTIAFPLINSQKRGYPPDAGAHVAIRTVRRFLEHWGAGINFVIFCLANPMDYSRYQKMLPLYFPRNYKEELYSKEELPRDVGNEFGETVIEERKIRISAFPVQNVGQPTPEPVVAKPAPRAAETGGDTQKVVVEQHSVVADFGTMKSDIDEEKKKKMSALSKDELQAIEQQQVYQQWIAQAKKTDLTEIARLSIIYTSGKDSQGRSIVVIIGNRLPENNRAILDNIFMYVIRLMDPLVNKDYIVVYLHTYMENREKPDFSWLQKAYKILDPRYGRNLKAFYIVHPTFWLKVAETIISAFMVDDSFWTKVRYIENLRELYNFVNHDQLVIPEDIHKYDYQEFGTYYGASNNAVSASESLQNNL